MSRAAAHAGRAAKAASSMEAFPDDYRSSGLNPSLSLSLSAWPPAPPAVRHLSRLNPISNTSSPFPSLFERHTVITWPLAGLFERHMVITWPLAGACARSGERDAHPARGTSQRGERRAPRSPRRAQRGGSSCNKDDGGVRFLLAVSERSGFQRCGASPRSAAAARTPRSRSSRASTARRQSRRRARARLSAAR